MGKRDEITKETLGRLTGDDDMPRDEAIKKILGRNGDLELAMATEICDPREGFMLILWLAPMMKGRATQRRFLDNAITAAVARTGFTKARSLVIDIAREWGFDLEKSKWTWGSLMGTAASFGRYDMVDRLLDIGASPEGRKKGEALDMLVAYDDKDGDRHMTCCRLLLEAGASISKRHLSAEGPVGDLIRATHEKRGMAKDKKIKAGKGKDGKGLLGKTTV